MILVSRVNCSCSLNAEILKNSPNTIQWPYTMNIKINIEYLLHYVFILTNKIILNIIHSNSIVSVSHIYHVETNTV